MARFALIAGETPAILTFHDSRLTIDDSRFGGEQAELVRLQDGAITAHLLVQDRENETIPLT